MLSLNKKINTTKYYLFLSLILGIITVSSACQMSPNNKDSLANYPFAKTNLKPKKHSSFLQYAPHLTKMTFDYIEGLEESSLPFDLFKTLKTNNLEAFQKLYPTPDELQEVFVNRKGLEDGIVQQQYSNKVKNLRQGFNQRQQYFLDNDLDISTMQLVDVDYYFDDIDSGTPYFAIKLDLLFGTKGQEKMEVLEIVECMKVKDGVFRLHSLPQ